jgi:hypothetical protein
MDYFLAKLLKVIKGVLLATQTHIVIIPNGIYASHHQWLRLNHPNWSNRSDFNGKFGRRTPPLVVRAFEHLEHANAIEEWKLNAKKEDSYPFIKTKVKQRSTLFKSPYWKV